MKTPKYAIVQHSAGAAPRLNPEFAAGLESRGVNLREATKVVHAGGVVFDSYMEAEDYVEAEQYPPAAGFSLIPQAPGRFSEVAIDGLPVYIPKG